MNKRFPASRAPAAQRAAKTERHDAEFFQERKRREAANLEKTIRLRNLRLAKEAADKEAERLAPPVKPAPRRKSRARTAESA
jgi:hypothetical protein